MKREHLNRIKSLLDRYDLGRTSLEEERILFSFFNSSEDMPSELHSYQDEFKYYSTFTGIHFSGSLDDIMKTDKPSILKKIGNFFTKWYVLSLIILIPLFILIYPNRTVEQKPTTNNGEVEKISDVSNNPGDTIPSTKKKINLKDTKITNNRPLATRNSLRVTTDSSHIKPQDTTNISDKIANADSLVTAKIPMQKSKKSVSPHIVKPPEDNLVEFTINESTSSGMLAEISYRARKAGIEYIYVVDYKKKLIKEYNVDMTIIGSTINNSVQVCVPKGV